MGRQIESICCGTLCLLFSIIFIMFKLEPLLFNVAELLNIFLTNDGW